MHLARLWIYPVKSLRGIEVVEARVQERGLEWDRRWMLVTPEGLALTQRELPAMARIATAIEPPFLRLSAAAGTVQVPLSQRDTAGPSRTASLWNDQVEVLDCGDEAATFLSDELGRACRLVAMNDEARRSIDPRYARPDDVVSLADGFPFLLAGEGSLRAINDWLAAQDQSAQPIEVERFRPNFLVAPLEAFAEDRWRNFLIGSVPFERVKDCSRCTIITLDPRTGNRDRPDVLQALARHRRGAGGAVFWGQNVIARADGTVRAGDPVAPLE